SRSTISPPAIPCRSLFLSPVATLRQRFYHSIGPGGLAGDRQGVVPASGFSFSAQQIWKVIKENRDLDLPAHKVMVATVRCEEIANENLAHMSADEEWVQLEEAVQHGIVPGFGKKLTAILNRCFSGFFHHVSQLIAQRSYLLVPKCCYFYMLTVDELQYISLITLDDFKEVFDKTLERGESFVIVAFDCTQSFKLKFYKICKGILSEFV
ncbi:unnamed protein product, partial [Musa banksii]